MALPKKKLSRSRRDRRRFHHALRKIHLVDCPQCHARRRPHHICPSCGSYRGVQYLDVKSKEPK